jgi:uncharacterized RDD family membrane protein YckC
VSSILAGTTISRAISFNTFFEYIRAMNENLDEIFDKGPSLSLASDGTRFLHHLIDYGFIMGLNYLLTLAISDSQGYLEFLSELDSPLLASLTNTASGIVLQIIYYTIMEGLFDGKTIGKLITKCRAVKLDGSPMTFSTALIRSLCRLIPFDGLSIFWGRIWHDQISKSVVVSH